MMSSVITLRGRWERIRLGSAKNLLQPDLLIRYRLNHTAWNDKGVCFAKPQGSAIDASGERESGFTNKQRNHESPYWHLRVPQFDTKEP